MEGQTGQSDGVGIAMEKLHDRDEAEQVQRLAAGWRRLLEIVERQRRLREGEDDLQVVDGGRERAA